MRRGRDNAILTGFCSGVHLDTVVGGDIRTVAADVSPWQGPPHPANGHRLTSAATGLRLVR